jgi:pimeloyl-ACP methyl ester carboxylesterase
MMQSTFTEANGIRIHYHRTGGDKPQVLLLHGLTDNGACWMPVIEQLQDDYDCIAPDARGHGLTDAPASGYAPTDHAADAAGLIQALKLNRPAVIGHSMGGAVAAVLASQYPALVRAMIAEDPAWFNEVRTPSPEQSEAMKKGWLEGMRENKLKKREALIAGAQEKNPCWSMAELEPWADAHEQVHEQVLQWMDAPPVDWRAALTQIQCPVLLVTGDVDHGVIISPQQAAEAQSLNAQLKVANIANTGHCVRRDDLAPFMQAVRNFLAQVS